MDNVRRGYWLNWEDAMNIKVGDKINIKTQKYMDATHDFQDVDAVYHINSVSEAVNRLGITEKHISANIYIDGKKNCGMGGVIAVKIPHIKTLQKADAEILYTSDEIELAHVDGSYKVTMYDNDGASKEITITKDGIIK